MTTFIELKMQIPPVTTREHLLGHAVSLNGQVYHHVLADGRTTACGFEFIGAPVTPVARASGRLCKRCAAVVAALER